jgi:diguanylate cyclase (GGDEF)-like protein
LTTAGTGVDVHRSTADGTRSPKFGRLWIVVAVLVGMVGIAGAFVIGDAVASRDGAAARQEFERTSADIASTLELAIRSEESLAISGSAFVLGRPDASNAQFNTWLRTVKAFDRYPELAFIVKIVVVPASGLAAYAATAVADPEAAIGPDGVFSVLPPGDRPFYCFIALGASRDPTARQPPGLDLCAPEVGASAALYAARDSGQGSYEPSPATGVAQLGVQTPIYRDGVVPETVEARRAAFVGWLGMTIDPTLVLERALQGHPGMTVSMRYQLNSSDVEYVSGVAAPGAQSTTIDLHNGWMIRTFGVVDGDGVFTNGGALLLLLAIVALSLVVAVLVLVLGTGRARALQLVRERTGDLRFQALHDALTGLPNRALIMDRIEQLLARNRRQGTIGAALFVDLDDFKNVNDTLGHQAGDRLLVAVAARLTTTLRDADTIGRMGGDEFVVLIDGSSVEAAPELVAERLLDVMRQPFELDGATLPIAVNTSIGIALGDRATGGDLLRDADVALYQAKAAGKNRYETFFPAMQTEISRRVELEFDLRSAIGNDQFRLVYQPIYRLDDLVVIGVEALLRWDHPTQGVIEPDEFIPILEKSGQIQQVGRWVLRQACLQMSSWHAEGDRLDVSVNVSGRQLDHDDIVEDVRQALEASGLDPGSLIIEITETALMGDATAAATAATAMRLRAIKALGVRIAVDDFGTGYSSLSYLQQFPVDCLKIDRRFTNAISTSPESKALIRTLIQLGTDLGLTTLAEGVETTDEMDDLRHEHVNEAQGFLLSRPLDPQTLEARILAPSRPATGVV